MESIERVQSSPEGQEEGNRLRARAGGVIEFRHEEGAGHNGLGQRFGATVRHNLSARPSGVWCGPSSSSDTSGCNSGLYLTPRGCDTWLYLTPRLRHVVVPHTTIKTQLVTVVAGRHRVPTRGGWTSVYKSCDARRPPPTTRIQSEAQDRVTGGFGHGRVPYTGLDTTA